MTYTPEDSVKLSLDCNKILGDLQTLMVECAKQGNAAPATRAQEYMLHGASRRVKVLHRSLENIFQLFPPSQELPLKPEDLSDVQINLHAFMINLYGVWENWAWAFIYRHGLESKIGARHNVGLFIKKTQNFLPSVLRDYLQSPRTSSWQQKYLKNYRDALAHRIPLYVPPGTFTPEEWEQYNKLIEEQFECIKSMRWERLQKIQIEQESMGRPCFVFLHSFSDEEKSLVLSEEEKSSSLALHTQLLCDSLLIVEFGKMFCAEWHQRAYPPELVNHGCRFRVRKILMALSRRLKILESRL